MAAQQQPSDQQVAAALAPLVSATTATGLASALAAAAGVPVPVAAAVIAASGPAPALSVVGPAARATAMSERTYRALYLAAAARRVRESMAAGQSLRQALAAERPNLQAHLEAAANRRAAAQLVDKAAARHGALLGWQARMDSRTSTECAAANGRNFEVGRRPVIGWPGSVHPHCRCRAVAPFAGAGMVGQVVTAGERKVAVA